MIPQTAIAATIASLFVLVGTASAQVTARPLTGLPVSKLATVYVLDERGRETSGVLLGFDADSITVRSEDGTIYRYPVGEVRRISKRGDSLVNGTLIGAVVGTAIGVLVAHYVSDLAGGKAVGILANTCIYAAAGAGIDALHRGRTTIYEAGPPAGTGPPPAPAERGFPGRIGLTFTVTW